MSKNAKTPAKSAREKERPAYSAKELKRLGETWSAHWQDALAIWSRYVKLSSPRFCYTQADEKREGLSGSFAMIRLNDHGVVVSLRQVVEYGLEDFPLEVMAHEIGHHVYCPGDLSDHGRMLARIRRGLSGAEQHAGLVANLYSDLLINDRLQRVHELKMDGVYRALAVDTKDSLWNFYMRIYEILWSLPGASLTAPGFPIAPAMEGDAQLGNRLIRAYASDQVRGSGRFAALCFPYLIQDGGAAANSDVFRPLLDADAMGAGSGEFPDGLARMDADELTGSLHPSLDPGFDSQGDRNRSSDGEADGSGQDQIGAAGGAGSTSAGSATGHAGNYREPFEYGQILQAMGLRLDAQDVAGRYYRERAIPHLVRYPVRETPAATEPLAEGLDTWEIGAPVSRIDWLETALRSPVVVPGYTTVERYYGTTAGSDPGIEAVDLDLYVDCSGSMPNPQVATSYLTLAGAIIALSALRVGAKVQATLWSGANQFQSTDGFVSHEKDVLRILTGYLGGGTAFPIHILRDTYGVGKTKAGGGTSKAGAKGAGDSAHTRAKADGRRTHILVISDDGVTTMFAGDEEGNSGWDISAGALESAGGGGTFVLQLWRDISKIEELLRAREMGWDIHVIRDWPDLVQFARAFSRKHYEIQAQERRR
ncbi:MAG: VWA domain-containing protein [bacterium]|nr:VWA domain-containing protein [bacterium]